MFERDKIAIDLGATSIRIMVGNKKIVKSYEVIKTPDGSFVDDKIIDLEAIKNSLQAYFAAKAIKTKEVCFALHGQDIVARHTELPIMDDSGIRTSLEWEMNQYLPKISEEYNIDYEILEKIDLPERRVLKLLVVAIPIGKVNKIVKLSEMLGFELSAIDITSNCACRVFRDIQKKEKNYQNVGVIDVGSNETSIIILDKGKLFIERELPFGVNNILNEIMKTVDISREEADNYLVHNISLTGNSEASEIEKRTLALFDNVFSSLEKIVTFFTIGSSKNNLDVIYLIGRGCSINGLKDYVGRYFNCPTYILEKASSIGVKTSIPDNCNINDFVGTLGLLLRKE